MISLMTDENNDLYLDKNKNIAVSRNRLESIKQLVNNKLQCFLGEIDIDLQEGVDYFGIILQEQVPIFSKINEITSKILEVEGVVSIENIDYAKDKENKIDKYNITIKTDAGNFVLNI
jgi:hypothetical protein